MTSFTQVGSALAARAPKFARSVPLRLGVTRVPRTCCGFCVRRAGATTPWYAQSPLGLRSVTHTLAAKARLMP